MEAQHFKNSKKSKFQKCLESGKHDSLVREDIQRAGEVGVTGTPAFFINGRRLSGAQPYEKFERLVQDELKK